jgi:DNA gyrase subunit A
MRYRTQHRGGKGVRDIKATQRNGEVVSVVAVKDGDQVLMMTSRGKIQRVNVAEIKAIGRNTQGVRIMRLDDGDTLAAVVPVPPSELEEAEAVDDLPPTGDVPRGASAGEATAESGGEQGEGDPPSA